MSKETTYWLRHIREAGSVIYPSCDIFMQLEIRDLWRAGILWLCGSLGPGHGTLGLTDKGLQFIRAYEEDWPVQPT